MKALVSAHLDKGLAQDKTDFVYISGHLKDFIIPSSQQLKKKEFSGVLYISQHHGFVQLHRRLRGFYFQMGDFHTQPDPCGKIQSLTLTYSSTWLTKRIISGG
jgi:hypothetical protein